MKTSLRKIAMMALTSFTFSAMASTHDRGQFTPDQVKEIQGIVHQYLVKNPNVLVEASQALQVQMQAKQQEEAVTAIKAQKEALFNNANSPVVGNPKGDVTLVEFFDYQCGHCKAMNEVIQSIIKDNPNLRVVFKELPIFGGDSQYAAKVALALYQTMPDKYYAFHDALFSETNPLTNTKVFKVARKIGLTEAQIDQLKQKMNDAEVSRQIKDNFKLAQALKLIGTPAFVITNKAQTDFRFIPGQTTKEDMEEQIKALS